jgi:hypothetical protein
MRKRGRPAANTNAHPQEDTQQTHGTKAQGDKKPNKKVQKCNDKKPDPKDIDGQGTEYRPPHENANNKTQQKKRNITAQASRRT